LSPAIISIIVLLAMFVIASTLPINLGVLAFAASYIVGGLFGGLTINDIFSGFPSSLVVMLAGVTYLFALAQGNGTVEWITDRGVRLVGGRVALIPWLMFGLTALFAAMGALAAAAIACVAPIALRFAARYSINSLLMGIMICLGSLGGSFSPISPFGVIVGGALTKNHLSSEPGTLFVNTLLFSVATAVIVFLLLGGADLWRRGSVTAMRGPGAVGSGDARGAAGPGSAVGRAGSAPGPGGASHASTAVATVAEPSAASEENSPRLTPQRAATLIGIVALVVGALAFKLDVGLLAFVIAVPLALLGKRDHSEVIKQIPWSVVLLIAGMLTYVGVLDKIGTLKYVGDLIAGGGSPLAAALAACFVAAVVSAFAATSGVLAATIPLAVPLLQHHQLSVIGTVTAISIAASIVDSSPLSTNGALLLANQQTMEERVFFRRLMVWAAITVIIGPIVAWLVFDVVGG
jgi:di/tricarboxylate transporter